MRTKQPRKKALWATAFPKQHARLTQPASDRKAARLESAKERRLLDNYERRIRARTPARAAQERLYRAEVKEWLRQPDNRICAVWSMSAEFREKVGQFKIGVRDIGATQCHHTRGRRGALLLDKRFWVAVSDAGHRWIESNPDKARALGLLCAKGQWNTPVA